MTATRALGASAVWVTGIVGAVTFAVAYDDATYALTSRSAVAVAVWWTIAVGVALGVCSLERLTRCAVVSGALLAGFAAWDLASTVWSASAEDAFVEFDRTALYLGVGVLPALGAVVYLTSSRGAVVALAGGIAVFMLAAQRRMEALRATLVGAAGSAASIGVVASGLDGWAGAVLVSLACVATAAALE